MTSDSSYKIYLSTGFDEAIEKISEALKKEGFGFLTRIDVHKKLKEKLNVNFHPYVILGACNPSLAFQAFSDDSRVGSMMPCNVIIEALEEGGVQACFNNPVQINRFADETADPELQDAVIRDKNKILAVLNSLLSGVK